MNKREEFLDKASKQIGNNGGQKFWSWYGFNYRVEWCACFVSWCANEVGVMDIKIPKFSYTLNGVNWFQQRNQYQGRAYVPNKGDIIFFDWDGGGTGKDHVGIVETVASGRVHTIEGNSSDMVTRRSYSLGAAVISGYGVPSFVEDIPEPPFIPEQIIPVGGISVGTNVFYQQGKLTNSAEKIPGNAVGGTGNAWVKSYLPSKTSPYLLMKDGINIGYTQREYISRVNQLPANGILEGTNVFCNLISDNQDTSPSKSTGYQSFWVAQYVDGNKKSPYRLVKDGVTKGFTNRDNIAKV